MTNLLVIKDHTSLNKVFETSQDKLVSVMFFTKNNPQCRMAKQHFERAASNNAISIFCIIDLDNYEGDERLINTTNNSPHFDFYQFGRKIGSYSGSDQKGIEESIRAGQQYVMNQAQIQQTQTRQAQSGPMQGQPQIPMQFTNPPMIYQQQPMQQQFTGQQYQPMPMQYPSSQPITGTTQSNPQMMGYPQPASGLPRNCESNSQAQGNNPYPDNATQNNIFSSLPTFQQMQQMFQIFQMMQQMGVLNMNQQITPTMESKTKIEGEEVLPNGDKIIPLGNGKYGLIKK
jgi:hypothetical protein